MRNKLKKWFLIFIVLIAMTAFAVKFGLPQLLRSYISIGIGDCVKIPILCMEPQETQMAMAVDKNCILEFIPHEFPKTKICVPKGFKVVQELVAKPYYKKKKLRNGEPVIYLLHQPPDFFAKLFPQVKKMGINTNYEFMRSLMHARESNIGSVNDAFFVILKSIFTPDLGDQRMVKMIQFRFEERGYFVNYNLSGPVNFFDCSVISKEGDFFKIYIKDTRKELDLDKVFSIISTISAA
ncbi:MAG: hypothetical protein Q7K98_05520 [Candidatus Omnitrophota bacterium]|nr:hypothetical protein [Candidatus Omnitrophota bacterium]